MDLVTVLIGIFIVIAAISVWAVSSYFDKKKRLAFQQAAQARGWQYQHDKDYSFARTLQGLRRLRHGDNRYVHYHFSGSIQDQPFDLLEYHYQVTTGSGKNRNTTHHHWRVALFRLPGTFPDLMIAPENIFDKFAAILGFDDINFESAEFSSKFKVESSDRKFAYDVCHPRMMEYLLTQPKTILEIDENMFALLESGHLGLENIDPMLQHLTELRKLLPEYLFQPAS
jgi:hypothetical protein